MRSSFSENPAYDESFVLHSLMQASEQMDHGFAMIFSDILFDPDILGRLVRSGKDIVLGIDNSYAYHKHNIDKKLNMVVSRKSFETQFRSLRQEPVTELVRVGKDIGSQRADFEFIGMAYLSQEGAKALREVYEEHRQSTKGPFHEADSFENADVTDMFQELIDRGFSVHGLEVNKGWREIHTLQDVETAEAEMNMISLGV